MYKQILFLKVFYLTQLTEDMSHGSLGSRHLEIYVKYRYGDIKSFLYDWSYIGKMDFMTACNKFLGLRTFIKELNSEVLILPLPAVSLTNTF